MNIAKKANDINDILYIREIRVYNFLPGNFFPKIVYNYVVYCHISPLQYMKAAMTKPASRLITLIMLIQNRPNQKAGDLAGELGVSVRTLHRYYSALDKMGIPICVERRACGGFSLGRDYKMPPMVFTPEEAVAVSLGAGLVEDLWGSLSRQAAHASLAKFENLLPEQSHEEVVWARRALLTAGLYHPGLHTMAAILESFRGAILETHQVQLLYQNASRLHRKPASQNRINRTEKILNAFISPLRLQ